MCVMEQSERFIDVVKQFPILWNTEMKDYRDSNKKDAVWKKIVEEINISQIPDIKTAKNEWKKLRDSHRESLKRVKASTSGQAAPPVNNWKHASSLNFLLPYMKNRKRISNTPSENQDNTSNLSNEEQDTATSEDIQNGYNNTQSQSDGSNITSDQLIPRSQRKRKVNYESLRELFKEIDDDFMQRYEQRDEEAKKNRHPLNLFFDSMCETTKNFPDWIQRDVKKKLFNIVYEAEETYENMTYKKILD